MDHKEGNELGRGYTVIGRPLPEKYTTPQCRSRSVRIFFQPRSLVAKEQDGKLSPQTNAGCYNGYVHLDVVFTDVFLCRQTKFKSLQLLLTADLILDN